MILRIGRLHLLRIGCRLLYWSGVIAAIVGYSGAILCFFGLFALQFYAYLRQGEMPSYSWNSVFWPLKIEGWAGLNAILFFAGRIHIAFLAYIPGALIGLFGFKSYEMAQDAFAAVTKELRAARQSRSGESPTETVSQ